MKFAYVLLFSFLLASCLWKPEETWVPQAVIPVADKDSVTVNNDPTRAPVVPGFCKWDMKQLSKGQQRICEERGKSAK